MPDTRKPSANTTLSPSKGFISNQSKMGYSLLEEWPHNYLAANCSRKEVTISEYSEMRIYNNDRSCRSNKYYSNADRKHFQAQAAVDASRIRNIISKCRLKTEKAIHHAVDADLIKHEELVGIEHLVSEKAATNLFYERRTHVASVLRAQELLQEKYGNVDPVTLARVANKTSSRSVERAQVRAAWSLNHEKLNLGSYFQHSMRFKTIKKPNIRGAYAA